MLGFGFFSQGKSHLKATQIVKRKAVKMEEGSVEVISVLDL